MSSFKAIGGYFGLELKKREDYHKNAVRLNSGRNAFEYILRANDYTKVFIPRYTCDVMLEPIQKLKIEYEFYSINENLEPDFDFVKVGDKEGFLYTNYFGLQNHIVTHLTKICPNLIIDNSQAFFDFPVNSIDTFYSPRKFFGVPDGAYLYCKKRLEEPFNRDTSLRRFDHLLERIDSGAEAGYDSFKRNDNSLVGEPMKKMSSLTEALLRGVDYEYVKNRRINNFNFLNKKLSGLNELRWLNNTGCVPMVYPFYVKNAELKQQLIENKIYVATYWPNVLKWCENNSVEYGFANDMLMLPIDQRYAPEDLERIVDVITKGLNTKFELNKL